MELRYCELCGEIIKAQGDEETLDKEQICQRCKEKQKGSSATAKKTPKAEEIAFRDKEQSTEKEGEPSAAGSGAISMQSFGSSELNLFSDKTIAQKKVQAQKKETTRSFTKIRLLNPNDSSLQENAEAEETEDKPAVSTATMPDPAGEDTEDISPPPPDDGMDQQDAPGLFSEEIETGAGGGEASQLQFETQQAPLQKQTMRFPCPVCHVKLGIQPVSTISKLTCPRCKTKMTVDANQHIRLLEIRASSTVIKKKPAEPKPPAADPGYGLDSLEEQTNVPPAPADPQLQAAHNTEAEPEEPAVSEAASPLKIAALGAVLTLPFAAATVLLYAPQIVDPLGPILDGFGEAVQRVFNALFS